MGAAISTATVFSRTQRLAYVTTLEGRVLALQPPVLPFSPVQPGTQIASTPAHADPARVVQTVPDALREAAAGSQSFTASTDERQGPLTARTHTQDAPRAATAGLRFAEDTGQLESHSTGSAEMHGAGAPGMGVEQPCMRSDESADMDSHAAGCPSSASHAAGCVDHSVNGVPLFALGSCPESSEARQLGESPSKGTKPAGMVLVWERPLATPVLSTPAVDETHGLLIVALLDGSVWAFNPRGEPLLCAEASVVPGWAWLSGVELWSQRSCAAHHHDGMQHYRRFELGMTYLLLLQISEAMTPELGEKCLCSRVCCLMRFGIKAEGDSRMCRQCGHKVPENVTLGCPFDAAMPQAGQQSGSNILLGRPHHGHGALAFFLNQA